MCRRTAWAGRGWRGRSAPPASTHQAPPPVAVTAVPLVLVRVGSRPPHDRRTRRRSGAGLVAPTTVPTGRCCAATGSSDGARIGRVRAVRGLRPRHADPRGVAGAGPLGPAPPTVIPPNSLGAGVATAKETPDPPQLDRDHERLRPVPAGAGN